MFCHARNCHTVLPVQQGRGRPRLFCSVACRDREYRARKADAIERDRRELARLRAELAALRRAA